MDKMQVIFMIWVLLLFGNPLPYCRDGQFRCFISYTLKYAIFQIRGNRITFKCVLTLGLSGIGTLLEQMVLSGFSNIFLIFLLKSFLRSLPV